MLGEPLLVVSKIARVLDGLGVRYVVGGSVASSIYGIPRATQDVDLVAELFGRHVDPLVASLEILTTADGPTNIRFASPEDTLLHKLVWFRMGDEVSDRQWGDVLGILKIQGELLDAAYLEEWAVRLEVADLLARARGQ